MSTPCNKTEVIDIIRDDVHEIKGDIKDLLTFKNKLIGFILASSTICTLIGNIIVFVIKK